MVDHHAVMMGCCGACQAVLCAIDMQAKKDKLAQKSSPTLADMLRAAREERCLSLREAGALVGVSGEAWRQWELGVEPSARHLAKVADSMGIPLTDIFFVIRA
jgi:DNA-binding XRE family transcriptional regulator